MLNRLIGLTILSSFLMVSTVVYAENELKPKLDLYKQRVNEAAKLISDKGMSGAEATFLNKGGKFFFDNKNGYIFVIGTDGVTYLNAAKPSLKGANLIKMKDIKDFCFFEGFINMGKKYGDGWIEYWWPKPGEVAASIKVSYVKLVKKNGVDYIVGAGLNDVTLADVYNLYPGEAKKKL